MTSQLTWEKSAAPAAKLPSASVLNRAKFLIGGGLMLAAVALLIFTSTMGGAQYFMTVDELASNPTGYVGQSVRVSGAVIGESIVYDEQNLIMDFTIVHVPNATDDLALALHEAVNNPDAQRLQVHIENQVKPDLLKNEAQAILTGKLGADGVFVASELLLKCPSRYEEAVPNQISAES